MENKKHWDSLALSLRKETDKTHPFLMNSYDEKIFKQFNKKEYVNILVLGSTLGFVDIVHPNQILWFIDTSPKMIERLREQKLKSNTQIFCIPWEDIPNLKVNFDLVLACGSFNCFGKQGRTKKLFEIIKKNLTPNGVLVSRYFDKASILKLKLRFKYTDMFKNTPREQIDYNMAKGVFYNFQLIEDYIKIGEEVFNHVTKIHDEKSVFPFVSFKNV